MKCTRFQKPNKKDGAEYGLYLTHDDRRKLIDSIKRYIRETNACYDYVPNEEAEATLERVLAELEVPT